MTWCGRWAPAPASGKSEVSRICADLDAEVGSFRDRSLAEQAFPYVFLDATYCKARVNRRVVSQAVVIATGVAADGHREVPGLRRRRQRGRRLLDRGPALAESPRGWPAPSWSSPTPTPA